MTEPAPFSIGAFSRASGLTVKALRHYHERGLLVPARVDRQTGYRAYSQANLDTAAMIRAMRELEVPLDEIAVILAECREDQDLLVYLKRHKAHLATKLEHYQGLVGRIDQVINYEQEVQRVMQEHHGTREIAEREVEPVLVAGLRMKSRYSDCGSGFAQIAKRLGRHIAGKAMCLYYDGEYREDDADFEPCFPIRKGGQAEGLDIRTLPGCRCVTLVHPGPYDTLKYSYAKVLAYANDKGYEIDLPTREVYLKGPGMIFKGNPKKYLTEIQLPIKA
ncbi:MAG: MerR family transcriptional regulator [Phycisphaeraceae bacterium]|nr:MerR family transcriptional regulator [Phycisphaeraceae bacterium]